MVIRSVVSEILGGGTTPKMQLSCQKEQMPLTVKFDFEIKSVEAKRNLFSSLHFV